MNLITLKAAPTRRLGDALADFEKQFVYPLGTSGCFRISHGREYVPYFHSLGDATVLVAEQAGAACGTLVHVSRHVGRRFARNFACASTVLPAHYLCDLKVAPAARYSKVLARLIDEARREIEASGIHACYCVVMDGTGRIPTDYTGRIGVPHFQKLADIMVLRVSAVPDAGAVAMGAVAMGAVAMGAVATPFDVAAIQSRIGWAGCRPLTGDMAARSMTTPVSLVDHEGLACGTLEDTRKGKRLVVDSGDELLSAHLSDFAYAAPESGARLLRRAASAVAAMGVPAVFAAVPRRETPDLLAHLDGVAIVQAPATVYGHGFEPGDDWWVNTSEI